MQSRQDEERKTYALNLRIRQSSVSTGEDLTPLNSPGETKENEDTGLEMNTITAEDD